MADAQSAMPRTDMKRMLGVSKKDPVNVALCIGKDAGTALVMMDKVKAPKAVLKLLTTQFPDGKDQRWGTAEVDVDDDPKLVKFRLNRGGGSLARKIAKGLKGTGYTRVIILDEEGTELDRHFAADEEEQEADGEAKAADGTATETDGAATGAESSAGPSLHELQKQLAALIAQVGTAAASVKAEAVKLAQEAGGHLKTAALEAAQASMDKLKALLEGGGDKTEAAAAGTGAGAVAYGKSRLAWVATRQRIQADLAKLRGELDTEFKDDPESQTVLGAFDTTVAPILATLDESLADKLDDVANETDPQKRAALVQEAKGILANYRAFIAGEALIGELDANPFVPLAIQKTLTATLTAIDSAVR